MHNFFEGVRSLFLPAEKLTDAFLFYALVITRVGAFVWLLRC